jgi:hypothetical protein
MLTDPGLGWHLKTGEYILSTWSVPGRDLFSFTRPDAPWVTYEWLFQALAAGLTAIGGLPLLSAVSALVYGLLSVFLYRQMVRQNSNAALAALFAILAAILLAAHAHARPHILTYLFFLVLAGCLDRYRRGELAAGRLVWFVPLTLLWANLHGGFVVGLVLVGLYFAGELVEGLASPAGPDTGKLGTYGLLGLAMTAGSLLNPAGWNLHFSILEYLSSDSLALMTEYQSPDFGAPTPAVALFEAMILGLVLLLAFRRRSLAVTECLLLAFFLYESLGAVRHMLLFALIAVPILARELTAVVAVHLPRLAEIGAGVGRRQAVLRSDPVFLPAIAVAFVAAALFAPGLFRADFDDIYLGRGAGEFIEANGDELGRMFNSSELGGALVYRFWPERKVFGDDRNDFYGDEFVIGEYFRILSARPDWQEVLGRYEVDSAIVLTGEVAGTLLRTSSDWELAYSDDRNEIFRRRE